MSPQKMSVLTAAEDYFSNINTIASRIYADFEETKSSYECVWNTLSSGEQTQILNECIIKPEISLKYSLKTASDKNSESSDTFGKKKIVDENVSYRDEHSGPFSFKTLSQVDLRLFTTTTTTTTSDVKSNVSLSVTPKLETPKVKPQKIPHQSFAPVSPPPQPPLVPPRSECSSLGDEHRALVSPSSQSSPDTSATELTDDTSLLMPKTGLDFLDNW